MIDLHNYMCTIISIGTTLALIKIKKKPHGPSREITLLFPGTVHNRRDDRGVVLI